MYVGTFRVYVAILAFFRVQQLKRLVLKCFEAASNVWDGTSQTHKMLVLQYLQLVPAKFLVNRAFPICQLHFTLFFLGIFRKPKITHSTWRYQPHVCGTFRVYVAILAFFRVQQLKRLVLKCFEAASNIYIYIIKLKAGPIFALWKLNKFVLWKSRSPCRKTKKIQQITTKKQFSKLKLVHFCCATFLDPFLALTWTSF